MTRYLSILLMFMCVATKYGGYNLGVGSPKWKESVNFFQLWITQNRSFLSCCPNPTPYVISNCSIIEREREIKRNTRNIYWDWRKSRKKRHRMLKKRSIMKRKVGIWVISLVIWKGFTASHLLVNWIKM